MKDIDPDRLPEALRRDRSAQREERRRREAAKKKTARRTMMAFGGVVVVLLLLLVVGSRMRSKPPTPLATPARPSAAPEVVRAPVASAEPVARLPPTPMKEVPRGPGGIVITATLPELLIPVDGVKAADLRDTFAEQRNGRLLAAIDIGAPRGTRVVAAHEGTIEKFLIDTADGVAIYQFDPDRRFAFHYARLERYAEGLREGQTVKRGQLLGYVGSSTLQGVDVPHLQFSVMRLGPEQQWWKGERIDPYTALGGR